MNSPSTIGARHRFMSSRILLKASTLSSGLLSRRARAAQKASLHFPKLPSQSEVLALFTVPIANTSAAEIPAVERCCQRSSKSRPLVLTPLKSRG